MLCRVKRICEGMRLQGEGKYAFDKAPSMRPGSSPTTSSIVISPARARRVQAAGNSRRLTTREFSCVSDGERAVARYRSPLAQIWGRARKIQPRPMLSVRCPRNFPRRSTSNDGADSFVIFQGTEICEPMKQ